MNPGNLPIFFIMGRPRSGTTLLSALFDAHPNVKIPPEYPIFLSLVQRFRKVEKWDEPRILALVDHIFQNNVFNHRTLANLKIDRDHLIRTLLSLEGEITLAGLLKTFNYLTFSLFPKQEILQIGDKNPLYSIYIDRFVKVFPDSKFICITRDYRDNFLSMKGLADLELEAPILPLQVYRWRFVAEEFRHYKRIYPERFHLVRYEDVVLYQEKTLKELCSFLGIPFEPSVFEFHRKKEESMKAYPQEIVQKVHKSLMNPVNTSRMGLWKKELSEAQVRMADLVAGKTAGIMGYERVYDRFSFPLWMKTRPIVVYGYLLTRLMQAGSRLPFGVSKWLTMRLTLLVRTWAWFSKKGKN